MTATKVCVQCGVEKLLVDFYRVRKGSEVRQSRCKRCDNESRAARNSWGRETGSTGKFCRLCLGLPWRVVGARCRTCGQEYREEGVP